MRVRLNARLVRFSLALGSLLLTGLATTWFLSSRAHHSRSQRRAHSAEFVGRALALDGTPLAGARVVAEGRSASTDPNGRFRLVAHGPAAWMSVSRAGYFSRVRAIAAGASSAFRLTPDDGQTISLHFGGDVMFGRRFYDPNEDGDTSDGLLQPGASVADHLRLVEGVRPLLDRDDLTIVNMETPLADKPYFAPNGVRPAGFHPAKDYVFASGPASVVALRQAGVDLLDLGNNHFYDRLEPGVRFTLSRLRRAGFRDETGHFGGGHNADEAWRPALVTLRRQRVAFIGCTTIAGEEVYRGGRASLSLREQQRLNRARAKPFTSYVATPLKGGAAFCTADQLRRHVRAARRIADVVVVMIHGGKEYISRPPANIQRLTAVARAAGATLVINGHPHVIGSIVAERGGLVAWTMGNLVFDQTVWPTFRGCILTVDIRRGRVIRAYTDPLLIDGFQPRAAIGGAADAIAREAAASQPARIAFEDGVAELLPVPPAEQSERRRLQGPASGAIFRLRAGVWAAAATGRVEFGRDLLLTGGFERVELAAASASSPFWQLEGGRVSIARAFAAQGVAGARLSQRAGASADAVLTPQYHLLVRRGPPYTQLVVPGSHISIVGLVRRPATAQALLRVAWYSDTRGPSFQHQDILLPAGDAWIPFRFDLEVPTRALTMMPFFRLEAPAEASTTADFDEIHVIVWGPRGAPASPVYDYLRVRGQGAVVLRHALLPGQRARRSPALAPLPLPGPRG